MSSETIAYRSSSHEIPQQNPDHPMYAEAVEAMKAYHQAQANGVTGAELERLHMLAEHRFHATTDYQLRAPAIGMDS
ncbi:hypothetical protein WF331_25565 [Pseudomonas sp. YNh]|uniref:hypothetical protein n=1 Tax=Pseudomonas sp. YNh TaxID=3133145 RepID=UPI0030F2BC1C